MSSLQEWLVKEEIRVAKETKEKLAAALVALEAGESLDTHLANVMSINSHGGKVARRQLGESLPHPVTNADPSPKGTPHESGGEQAG